MIRIFIVAFACFSAENCVAALVSASHDTVPGNNKLLPVIWQQRSAEYRALCYQAYNIAKWRLEKIKLKRRHAYAIITDIDETVLDNSYYEAENIINNTEFAKDSWNRWTAKANATPVPGAVEFLKFARSKGVSIFYISNRDTTEISATVSNLAKYNFPDADKAHMIFAAGSSSKETRRLSVTKDYKVIMLLGDNLNDFTSLFEKKDHAGRWEETDNVKSEWGNKFIVLPNATYGEWENASYNYERGLTQDQKNQKLRNDLIPPAH